MMTVTGSMQEGGTFHRYGNHYFFVQAWVDVENAGLQAPKARSERAAER